MAMPYRKTKKKRKHTKTNAGKDRKRKLRAKGSTPSLEKLLGPCRA
ncbi:MAG: hypothetical protein V1495_07670 [Pseudomonadota bacterium]